MIILLKINTRFLEYEYYEKLFLFKKLNVNTKQNF